LRKELGVMPPGDIRQCLVGLSYTDDSMKELFKFRFHTGSLAGHTVGNIIISALEKITGNVDEAISIASKMLNVRGAVLPVTLKPTILSAVLENGEKIEGEHKIDIRQKRPKIKNISLKPAISANPEAIKALKHADVIILGPGDLYTSILPNLLANGIIKAIDESSAKKILVANIMTTPGQTEGYAPADFVNAVNKFLGKKKLDTVIINSKKPASTAMAAYKKEGAKFIEPISKGLPDMEIVEADVLSAAVHKQIKGDKLNTRSKIRHDSDKLAKLIWELV